tara:strand:+ start:8936 stop:9436 length:501 start_codon:yes stop_codon:yes gene_type:complete
MDILGLISGATSNLRNKVGEVETAIDKAYQDSPLGKLENSFTNSAIHKSFEGGKFGGGGGGGMTHAAVDDVQSGYQDSTEGLQGVMSQANILNPMASMLREGGYSDVAMPDYNTFNPNAGSLAQAPSQQPDQPPELDEMDELEEKADRARKGVLAENSPVPMLIEY